MYLLFTISIFSLIIGTLLYVTRHQWLHLLPDNVQDLLHSQVYTRLPTSFMGDVEGGFSSADFDLSSNIMEGDSRTGLDQQGKRDVQRIMRSRNIGFDEARRIYMEQRFKKNNIGADGLPRDPKFVSFS